MELEHEVFDLHELVKELAEVYEPRCLKKALTWRSSSERVRSGHVKGDLTRTKQILFNLIGNAIKFTDSGFVSLTVSDRKADIQTASDRGERSDGHWVRFEVQDSGGGISQEDREAIFGSFVQGQMGREKGGTGLGLAIAHRLVRLMKGELSLELVDGQGSLFGFEVPLQSVGSGESAESRLKGSLHLSAASTESLNVMVVDDNPDNRLLLKLLLEPMGAIVTEAVDGMSALSALEASEPDIVLMDLRMPGMNGYQTLERIREDDHWQALPVIAVTASAFRHEQEVCLKSGFNGFISKPIDANELTRLLERMTNSEVKARVPPEEKQSPKRELGCALDSETFNRLKLLIEQYRRTELSEALNALEGAAQKEFAEHCQGLVVSGDWKGLIAALASCRVLSESSNETNGNDAKDSEV